MNTDFEIFENSTLLTSLDKIKCCHPIQLNMPFKSLLKQAAGTIIEINHIYDANNDSKTAIISSKETLHSDFMAFQNTLLQ